MRQPAAEDMKRALRCGFLLFGRQPPPVGRCNLLLLISSSRAGTDSESERHVWALEKTHAAAPMMRAK